MIKLRWETSQRYYLVMVHTDLFDHLILTTMWGGRDTRLGGEESEVIDSLETAQTIILDIHKRRMQRGYELVKGTVDFECDVMV